MIIGAHSILYSPDPDGLRAFLRDVLELGSVDAGGGWLIFALPPGEVAVHPADQPRCELYLMCDDLDATMAGLRAKGVAMGEVSEERWGMVTYISIPGGGQLGLYEPFHPTAIGRKIRSGPVNGDPLNGRRPTSHERLTGLPWDASYRDGPAPGILVSRSRRFSAWHLRADLPLPCSMPGAEPARMHCTWRHLDYPGRGRGRDGTGDCSREGSPARDRGRIRRR